jgi:hypothetical protein
MSEVKHPTVDPGHHQESPQQKIETTAKRGHGHLLVPSLAEHTEEGGVTGTGFYRSEALVDDPSDDQASVERCVVDEDVLLDGPHHASALLRDARLIHADPPRQLRREDGDCVGLRVARNTAHNSIQDFEATEYHEYRRSRSTYRLSRLQEGFEAPSGAVRAAEGSMNQEKANPCLGKRSEEGVSRRGE